MSQGSTLVKKTGIYAIGNIGSKILSYIMVFVYSYYITSEELGYYDIIMTTVSMLQPIVTMQLQDGLYRYLVGSPLDRQQAVLKSGFRCLMLTTVLSELIYVVVIIFFPVKYPVLIALYFATTVFYVALQDSVRGLGNSKTYALIGILNSAVMLIVEVIGVVVLKMSVEALMLGKIIANAICIIILLIKQRELRCIAKKGADKAVTLELLKYSTPLVPNTICWWVVNSSDRYIIAGFLGTAANGVYTMSNKFPTILTTITSIFYLAWQESALKEYNSENRDAFFSGVFHKYFVLLFTLGICAIPATRVVVESFIAKEYRSAWMYTSFLYLGAIFSALCSFLGIGYQISKETKKSLFTTIFAAVINAGVNVALINFIGLQAAALSTFVAYFFLFIIRIKHTKRYFSLSVKWWYFIILFALMAGMAVLSYFIDIMWVQIILLIAAFAFMCFANRKIFFAFINKFKKKKTTDKNNS